MKMVKIKKIKSHTQRAKYFELATLQALEESSDGKNFEPKSGEGIFK